MSKRPCGAGRSPRKGALRVQDCAAGAAQRDLAGEPCRGDRARVSHSRPGGGGEIVVKFAGWCPGAVGIACIAASANKPEEKDTGFRLCRGVAASGGYWLALAGDDIFGEEMLVGSIGVISGGFGLQELIKRSGIERRLYTAGTHKSLLDPFLPVNPEDVERLTALQQDIYRATKTMSASAGSARSTPPTKVCSTAMC